MSYYIQGCEKMERNYNQSVQESYSFKNKNVHGLVHMPAINNTPTI